MKITRTENARRNILTGVLLKLYQTLVPFLMRTAIMHFLGVQYLGLNGAFYSVLQVLNLAELGVSNAIVYSMYKPIAEDDTAAICRLLRLYRKLYVIIGAAVLCIGLVILPLLPVIVNKDVPEELSLYGIYFLNLGGSVLSYWTFAYMASLLTAHQRVDVINRITLVMMTIQYALQLAGIVFFKNYYVYLSIAVAMQAATNLLSAYDASKRYPDYRPRGKMDPAEVRSIGRQVRDLFTARVSGVIVNSADSIVISAFLGITVLAVYQNYYYIINALSGVIAAVFQACIAGIGNSIIVEAGEKNYRDLTVFTQIIVWLGGFCTCCLLCLYQPFMELWMGEEHMLSMGIVVCFCIYFFTMEVNQLLNTYKDAAGIWSLDRLRPITTAGANLVINLLTVRRFGLYGILLSTVISMAVIGMPWLIRNLFCSIFPREHAGVYSRKLLGGVLLTAAAAFVCWLACRYIDGDPLKTFFLRLPVCMVIPNVIYWLCYRKSSEFDQCVALIRRMTGRGKRA